MISRGRCCAGEVAQLVEVDPVVLAADAVADRLEPLAGEVGRRAVGQVAAGGERHAEHGVAWLSERDERREVGRRAAVRLDVGEAAAEQPPGPLDREALGDVDILAAAVVAPARDSPRRTCWSAPSPAPRAPPGSRCSPTRSARSGSAGARARPRSRRSSGSSRSSERAKKSRAALASRAGAGWLGDMAPRAECGAGNVVTVRRCATATRRRRRTAGRRSRLPVAGARVSFTVARPGFMADLKFDTSTPGRDRAPRPAGHRVHCAEAESERDPRWPRVASVHSPICSAAASPRTASIVALTEADLRDRLTAGSDGQLDSAADYPRGARCPQG